MDGVLLLVRLCLSATCALAGITKATDPAGTPGRLDGLAAAGTLALLPSFIVAIGVSMARGRRPDCHCFGQLHSAPIGWPALARNALLSAMAGLVILKAQRTRPPSYSTGSPAWAVSKRRRWLSRSR